MDDLAQLAEFLVDAKRHTYASGTPGRKEKDNSFTHAYTDGDWSYKDQYFGSDHFVGHETVWRTNEPVWGLNYHGVRLDTLFDLQRLFAFLREALQLVEVTQPLRGPEKHTSNDLTYANYVTGDLASFRGVEMIYQTGRALYSLDYHGGTITE